MNVADAALNSKFRVMLIEDNEDDILMLQEFVMASDAIDMEMVARDGEEGLAYLRRKAKHNVASLPDLVLLDINMPKKNGFEVLREVKRDPLLQHLVVAVLTSSTREEDIIQAYSEGANSYINKPADFEQFQQIIKNFL